MYVDFLFTYSFKKTGLSCMVMKDIKLQASERSQVLNCFVDESAHHCRTVLYRRRKTLLDSKT
jgi:hypothetical protein